MSLYLISHVDSCTCVREYVHHLELRHRTLPPLRTLTVYVQVLTLDNDQVSFLVLLCVFTYTTVGWKNERNCMSV